nr:inorganic pyrophosphatase [Nanoarchaeum sp.]
MKSAKDFLNKTVKVVIDRPMGSKHPKFDLTYPVNYGFVPNTVSGDGEPIDVYVLGILKPVKTYKGKVIAVIHRTNDNDDKLIVVPIGVSLTNFQIKRQISFQEKYFKSRIIKT